MIIKPDALAQNKPTWETRRVKSVSNSSADGWHEQLLEAPTKTLPDIPPPGTMDVGVEMGKT